MMRIIRESDPHKPRPRRSRIITFFPGHGRDDERGATVRYWQRVGQKLSADPNWLGWWRTSPFEFLSVSIGGYPGDILGIFETPYECHVQASSRIYSQAITAWYRSPLAERSVEVMRDIESGLVREALTTLAELLGMPEPPALPDNSLTRSQRQD